MFSPEVDGALQDTGGANGSEHPGGVSAADAAPGCTSQSSVAPADHVTTPSCGQLHEHQTARSLVRTGPFIATLPRPKLSTKLLTNSEKHAAKTLFDPEMVDWGSDSGGEDDTHSASQPPTASDTFDSSISEGAASLGPAGLQISWQHLSFGVQWVLLKTLCEGHCFTEAFAKLGLSLLQVRGFLAQYIEQYQVWSGHEQELLKRSGQDLALEAQGQNMTVSQFIHQRRPHLGADNLSDELVGSGAHYLESRGLGSYAPLLRSFAGCKMGFLYLPVHSDILQDALDQSRLHRAVRRGWITMSDICRLLRQGHTRPEGPIVVFDSLVTTLDSAPRRESTHEPVVCKPKRTEPLFTREELESPLSQRNSERERQQFITTQRYMQEHLPAVAYQQNRQETALPTQVLGTSGSMSRLHPQDDLTSSSLPMPADSTSSGHIFDVQAVIPGPRAHHLTALNFQHEPSKEQPHTGISIPVLPQPPSSAAAVPDFDHSYVPARSANPPCPTSRDVSGRVRITTAYPKAGPLTAPHSGIKRLVDQSASRQLRLYLDNRYHTERRAVPTDGREGARIEESCSDEEFRTTTKVWPVPDEAKDNDGDYKPRKVSEKKKKRTPKKRQSEAPGGNSGKRLAPTPKASKARQPAALVKAARPSNKAARPSVAGKHSENLFGMYRFQVLPSPRGRVAEALHAWSADRAEFAAISVRARFARTADRLVPSGTPPGDLTLARQTLGKLMRQYELVEERSKGDAASDAETAKFAGCADWATYAREAEEACFADIVLEANTGI